MRHITFLMLFVCSVFMLSASGNGGCGTTLPADYTHASTYADRVNFINQFRGRSAIQWIGNYYHIITKSDGTGGALLKDVFDAHCELNMYYNPFNIGFYIAGIDTIKDTNLWNYQNQTLGYSTFQQKNIANVCNVYVNGNLPGLCGFATFPSGTSNRQGGIFMNKSCMTAGDKTFPHEMGHYLNLPHTFETGGGIEFVDGSNCATAGDGFCDTPADFVDYRAPCPYTGDSVDPKGDLYRTVIDETLLMSYFSDNCVNRFSNEQMAEMNWALTNKRSYLLNRPMPDVTPLDSVVFTAPASVPVTFTSSSYTFKWNSVPRAQYYRLRVQSATSSQAIVDTLIRDTTYTVTNFFVNKTYKFRVKAISYGNTCGDNANYQPLSFTMPTGVNDLDAKVSMKIFPNPANDASVLNLQVALNEKAEAVISLFNLNGQMIQQMHRSFIEGTNNMQINIEELSSGMYFIQLKSNDAIKTERVSIIR